VLTVVTHKVFPVEKATESEVAPLPLILHKKGNSEEACMCEPMVPMMIDVRSVLEDQH
jgi:hypothetical protein